MFRKSFIAVVLGYFLVCFGWVVSSGVEKPRAEIELLNVACDPTRELWSDLNEKFISHYEIEHGVKLAIRQSHGGSGSQARAIVDGLNADVATLALWLDTDAVRKAGLIDSEWEKRFRNRSLPFTSTIVFVVRRGNPKNIHDWPDLVRRDIEIITPNPKTSGNGKWSFLALWGSVLKRGGSEAQASEYVTNVYRKVPVLDAAARGATMTFAQKGVGDVHLTWENEAIQEIKEANGALELVYPSMSVLAEPHVAIVDANVKRKGTKNEAEAYLNYLYTDEAQEIIAKHGYRPTNPETLLKTADQFAKIELFPVVPDLASSWEDARKRFFAEGAEFDKIYVKQGR